MTTTLTTRITTGLGATVKNAPLNNEEIDANFISLNTNKLEASNNLSDLPNTTIARTNLGLVIGTHVQPHDINLDSIVGLSGTSGVLKKTGINTWALDNSSYLMASNPVITGTITQNGQTGGITPIGGIIMWSGTIANIPSGWALCDGNNGTPNLIDRFIVGAGATYAPKATGGSKDAIIVRHDHAASSYTSTSISDPGHVHTFPGDDQLSNWATPIANIPYDATSNLSGGAYIFNTGRSTTGISASSSTSTSVGITGSDGTNANLPPYLALAFIMRIS